MAEINLNWNQVQQELKGFVYKRTRNKDLTEDIVHDVFIKIQGKIHQLKETEKIFGWIYQVTRNTITDHYRKNSRTLSAKEIDWESQPQNFNDCVTGVINELIPTLPEKYRIPLEMTEFQDLSQQEIAERLNVNYSTAKSRIQRARQMLKNKIDEVLIVKTDGYGNVVLCKNRNARC